MITIARPKEFGGKVFITTAEVTSVGRCSSETNKLRYVHSLRGTPRDITFEGREINYIKIVPFIIKEKVHEAPLSALSIRKKFKLFVKHISLVVLNIFTLSSFMCDILFQDKALNKLVLNGQIASFCCFSQFSAFSTEKFNRSASSWQHEFFTTDVDRQYKLNGRILPGKCAHV